MIPDTKSRVTTVRGESASAAFGISSRDTAHIMRILRDAIYTDKIMAVLREYSSNAWDAHREAGKDSEPIQVTLPTEACPLLEIRDFGHGLSHEDVFELFTQYGASTKRSSDKCVGMLGIGSKSGFAYSDSFTIISHHGGTVSTYVAILGSDERSDVKLMDERPSDETGIAIQIAVQPKDISGFHARAKKLFQHFEPRPRINCDLPVVSVADVYPSGRIISASEHMTSEWTAVMGCVGYRVNMNQLNVPDYVRHAVATLTFGIGELTISASREELEYTDATVALLEQRACNLIDEYVSAKLAQLESAATSDWERRLLAHELGALPFNALRRKSSGFLTESSVTLRQSPKLIFKKNSSRRHDSALFTKLSDVRLEVSREAMIIVRDDKRALSGYHLSQAALMVFPAQNVSVEDALAELRAQLSELRASGVPLKLSSEVTSWSAPPKKTPAEREKNAKHSCKLFIMPTPSEDTLKLEPASARWDVVTRTPSDSDVYVELSCFRAKSFSNGEELELYEALARDIKLLRAMGVQMPALYGYKVLKRDTPAQKRAGRSYWEWRADLIARAIEINPACRATLVGARLASSTRELAYGREISVSQADLARVTKKLGADHPATSVLSALATGAALLSEIGYHTRNALLELLVTSPAGAAISTEADLKMKSVTEKWPLLRCQSEGIAALFGKFSAEWIAYVAQ